MPEQTTNLVCIHINDALDLLLRPDRLKATLQNRYNGRHSDLSGLIQTCYV